MVQQVCTAIRHTTGPMRRLSIFSLLQSCRRWPPPRRVLCPRPGTRRPGDEQFSSSPFEAGASNSSPSKQLLRSSALLLIAATAASRTSSCSWPAPDNPVRDYMRPAPSPRRTQISALFRLNTDVLMPCFCSIKARRSRTFPFDLVHFFPPHHSPNNKPQVRSDEDPRGRAADGGVARGRAGSCRRAF